MLSRRNFLFGVPAYTITGAIGISGPACGLLAKDVIVPVLLGEALSQLVDEAKRFFDNRSFTSGAVLRSTPAGVTRITQGIDDSIRRAFAEAPSQGGYATPISLNVRGQARHLQLRADGSTWSLITGGPTGQSVYEIHDAWLTFLLQTQHCNYRVDGPSLFDIRCSVPGCAAVVTSQDFLDVSGKRRRISMVTNQLTPTERRFHDGHIVLWQDCRVDGDQTPEYCP